MKSQTMLRCYLVIKLMAKIARTAICTRFIPLRPKSAFDMPDIALIGERSYLFEKLFQDLGLSFQFVSPSLLGSPFLPQYRAVIIPTGFANPRYSDALPALQRSRSNISGFVKSGGVLTVFGPMTAEHSYGWLPHPLRLSYVFELSSRQVSPSADECSCLLCTPEPECDGYLVPGEGFRVVLSDEEGKVRPRPRGGSWGRGSLWHVGT